MENLRINCASSPVGSFNSDDLGCYAICWYWANSAPEIHSQHSCLKGNINAHSASVCWQTSQGYWSHFPAGFQHPTTLQIVPKAGSATMVLLGLGWPSDLSDLIPIENLQVTVKRQMRDTRPKQGKWPEDVLKQAGLHTNRAPGWSSS